MKLKNELFHSSVSEITNTVECSLLYIKTHNHRQLHIYIIPTNIKIGRKVWWNIAQYKILCGLEILGRNDESFQKQMIQAAIWNIRNNKYTQMGKSELVWMKWETTVYCNENKLLWGVGLHTPLHSLVQVWEESWKFFFCFRLSVVCSS